MTVTHEKKSSRLIWWVIQLVVPLLSAAVAALITIYYTQNVQTVVSYSITTTSLGAGADTRSVLPDLKLILGDKPLPAVYTHTVALKHDSGPELDEATIGIKLASASHGDGHIQLLGNILAYGPDPVHKMACADFDAKAQSAVCKVGQISKAVEPYKMVMATNQSAVIALSIQGKNTRIQRSEDARRGWIMLEVDVPGTITVVVIVVVFFMAGMLLLRWQKNLHDEEKRKGKKNLQEEDEREE